MIASENRVLVVDDERALRDMLDCGLSRAGFAVRTAADGHQALQITKEWNPEVVVLDVMLPEIDGFTLLPTFREITDAPIIMLSAKAAIEDKVFGLARGADDYIAKPFELDELIARINSAIRRMHLNVRHVVTYGDLTVDVGRQLVHRGERRIDLSKKEFILLLTFLKEPAKVFSRSELIDLVWGDDRDVTLNIVETYVSYLRGKIDADEPVKLIHTVRGSGYLLRAEAT